jgi:thiol-disulfide isomerase/thioredoxin
MKYFPWILFLSLLVVIMSCQNPEKKITIDSVKITRNRTSTLKEKNIVFFDCKEQKISSDKFNQLLAGGIYLTEQRYSIDGIEEIHLLSIDDHTKKLEHTTIPSFQISDLNGNLFTNDSLKNKVTVLSFWFTASHSCRREIHKLNPIAQKYKTNKKHLWLAPALEKTTDLSHFLKNRGLDYNFIANEEALALKFGILTYPTHLIVNQEGEIVKAIVRDPNSEIVIDEVLKQLLQGV